MISLFKLWLRRRKVREHARLTGWKIREIERDPIIDELSVKAHTARLIREHEEELLTL